MNAKRFEVDGERRHAERVRELEWRNRIASQLRQKGQGTTYQSERERIQERREAERIR